ncbi:MAG: hypothetical protein J6V25_04295 [Oscillospiraceae bacterium]|nr:hypothetical protein [Oscillospiraceae bacterium]
MYKGKFDQKHKGDGTSVHEIVTQRNTAPVKEAPAAQAPQRKVAPMPQPAAARPTPVKGRPAPTAPAPKKSMPVMAEPEAPKKKGPRLGSVIFYTLYFMFILVFFIATYIGLNWLQSWLTDYEAAQPTVKSQQVFTQLFTDPDWGALYEAAGAKDSPYEGKDAYVDYMEAKVGDTALTFMETSAGLSGDKKYVVRLGNEKVATFTLVDKNAMGETTLENITELPDWQLGSVEVFFEREGVYYVEMLDGHTAYVNDVPLTDEHTIQIATTMAQKYLPEGTTGASINTQQVTGLMATPTVTVFDEKGNPMTVTYDEATHTFTERTEANTMSADQETLALAAAKAFCLWMIEEGNRADIAKYYDSSSQVYKDIIRTTELWMQNHNGYQFKNESVTNFAMYNENMFSVRVSLDLQVTRTDGTTKDYPYAQSLFFHKDSTGAWKVFDRTNVDVSQPVGKVRLTFMQGDTLLTTNFFDTDAKDIITPIISPIPEGKVFSGWVRQTVDEEGNTVLTVMFVPDETGKVVIPEGTVLEPMVLYALFEDAPAGGAAADTTEGA